MMKITFGSINDVESKAKNADVFICLADTEHHPCITKRFETDWAKKQFISLEINDEGRDHRYKSIEYKDLLKLGKVFEELSKTDKWIHINCFAGLSRSAAMTLFALLHTIENPTLKDYQKLYGEIEQGKHRIPSIETFPNLNICVLTRKYFNLPVYDGEFGK